MKIIIALFIITTEFTFAQVKATFDSVPEMISEFSDYSEENGTFKVIKKDPLHIQLSTTESKKTPKNVIRTSVQRSILYGIYRSFIHTEVDKITVTAVPKELTDNRKNAVYMKNFEMTVTMTRKDALKAVKVYFPEAKLRELVGPEIAGGLTFQDSWTSQFKKLYWEDVGEPGIDKFFITLLNIEKKSSK